MKSIITSDKANIPYGYAQLDGSGNLTSSISVNGTASYALNSDLATSSSYAITASYIDTASYAITASYALNGGGGGTTFPYTGSAIISGSLEITGSLYLDTSVVDVQTQIDSKTNKLIITNRQTSSYTLDLSDADKLIEMNSGSANDLTVPPSSSVPFNIGTQILIAQYGLGQTTVVTGSGVTIRSSGNRLRLSNQYSGATLIKIDSDEWYLFGDITF